MTVFRKRFAAWILTGVLAAVFAGCGAERESTTAPAGESPEGKAVEMTKAEIPALGQLPSDFPADVPTYPGAVVQQSMSVPNHSLFVTFLTTASREEVYGFYRKQLQNHGWSISEASDDKHHLTVSKKGRTVSIMAIASGARTEIGISVQGG